MLASTTCQLCTVSALCRFPRGTPSGYVSLCLHCLEASPKARPSFDEVLSRLGALYAKLLAKAARSLAASQPQPAVIAGPPGTLAPAQPSTRFGSRLGFLSRASSRPSVQQPAEPATRSSIAGVHPPVSDSLVPEAAAAAVGGQHHGRPERHVPQPPRLLVTPNQQQEQQQGLVIQPACSGTSAALPSPAPAWPVLLQPQPGILPQLVPPTAPVEPAAPGVHVPRAGGQQQGLAQAAGQVTWPGTAHEPAPACVPARPPQVFGTPVAPGNYSTVGAAVAHQQLVQQAWGCLTSVTAGQTNNTQPMGLNMASPHTHSRSE